MTWTLVGDAMPDPHRAYRVWAEGRMFDATPCYGLYAPWWVPRNGYTRVESDPIDMLKSHLWALFQEPPEGAT